MIDKANVGGTVHDINDTGARGMISPDVFSTAAAYEAGEYCIYNNTLYKFTEAKSAGAWDDSKASATDIASELSALNSSIVVKEFSKTISIAKGGQSFITFEDEIIPNGYSVIAAWGTSEHPSSVLCGGPYVEKNKAIIPYIANQPAQNEPFHLYIALKRS